METRNLKNETAHYLTIINNWLQSRREQGKPVTCPFCPEKTEWKWVDVFQIPFRPHTEPAKSFAVLTCECGYAATQSSFNRPLKMA
jgi:hypothetical protein